MARLPQPGLDDNVWGDILNEYLSVSHNADGTLRSSGIPTPPPPALQDLTDVDLDNTTLSGQEILEFDSNQSLWVPTSRLTDAVSSLDTMGITNGVIGDGINFPSDVLLPHSTSLSMGDSTGQAIAVLSFTSNDITTLQSAGEGISLTYGDGSPFISSLDDSMSGVAGARIVDFNGTLASNLAAPELQTDAATLGAASNLHSFDAPSAFGTYFYNSYFDNGSALGGPNTNVSLDPDTIYLMPFSVGHDGFLFDNLGVVVQSGNEIANAEAYFALYGCEEGASVPSGAPLESSGPVDASTAGLIRGDINGNLQPGRMYWLAIGTSAEGLAVLGLDNFAAPRLGLVNGTGTAFYSALSQSWTPGDFPEWTFNLNQRVDLGGTCPSVRLASLNA